MALVWPSITSTVVGAERRRRHDARTVPRVDAGLLDVFHDGADQSLACPIAYGVDVDLDRILQELVDEHRPFGREASFPPEGARQRSSRSSPAPDPQLR